MNYNPQMFQELLRKECLERFHDGTVCHNGPYAIHLFYEYLTANNLLFRDCLAEINEVLAYCEKYIDYAIDEMKFDGKDEFFEPIGQLCGIDDLEPDYPKFKAQLIRYFDDRMKPYYEKKQKEIDARKQADEAR